jgi:hypothetical protein
MGVTENTQHVLFYSSLRYPLAIFWEGSLQHEHWASYTAPRVLDMLHTADRECALMPTPPRHGGGWSPRGVFLAR